MTDPLCTCGHHKSQHSINDEKPDEDYGCTMFECNCGEFNKKNPEIPAELEVQAEDQRQKERFINNTKEREERLTRRAKEQRK